MRNDTDTPLVARVRALIAPIVSDLGLDIYDLELRGGTLRLTLDTPLAVEGGVTLDRLSLASRLISKEFDAVDPIPSRYTLEVTSPGVERPLRTADHFRRSVGDEVALRLSDVESDDRRVRGVVVAADDQSVVVRVDGAERTVQYHQIDRARTVFEWGGAPKPGRSKRAAAPAASTSSPGSTASDASTEPPTTSKEHQP